MKFSARFPEDLFPANSKQYNKDVIRGYEICKNKTIQVIGLAYNCGQIVGKNIERCNALREMFKSVNVTIYENGSTDNTLDVIKKSDCKLISEERPKPDFNPLSKSRFTYMAEIRNVLLDNLESCDYTMVYDFDILGGFSYDGIAHSVGLDKEAVVSNGIIYQDLHRKMYDYISFRENSYLDLDDPNHGELCFNRGDKPLKVKSGFGGLGLYQNIRNRYSDKYGCEHIGFHEGLEVYLNPSQIVLYNESSYND